MGLSDDLALEAIGKALSNKNMSVLMKCAKAHRAAIALHTEAADLLEALIKEHTTKEAAIVRIVSE